MQIREIEIQDAPAFLALCRKLDEETQLMLLEPGERTTTVEEQTRRIQEVHSQDNSTILVAEHEGQLVGYVSAQGGRFHRNRHSAYLVVGIRQSFTGRGLGTQLFTAIEEWAQQQALHRLELTVMSYNRAGLALYQKMGFAIEGLKKHALLVNENYVDEYYMAKLL